MNRRTRGALSLLVAALFIHSATSAFAQEAKPGAQRDRKETVVFMCPYGGAKSLVASSYFNREADLKKLPFTAIAVAAETPYEVVPEKVASYLESDGFKVRDFKPRHAEGSDFSTAKKVVSIDCDLTKIDTRGVAIERWDDVPKISIDLPGSVAAIRRHIDTLIAELEAAAR